jgi:hypothetical protein
MATATNDYTISVMIDGKKHEYGHGCGAQWNQSDCDVPGVPGELPEDIYRAAIDGVSDVFEFDGMTWVIDQH